MVTFFLRIIAGMSLMMILVSVTYLRHWEGGDCWLTGALTLIGDGSALGIREKLMAVH